MNPGRYKTDLPLDASGRCACAQCVANRQTRLEQMRIALASPQFNKEKHMWIIIAAISFVLGFAFAAWVFDTVARTPETHEPPLDHSPSSHLKVIK